MAKNEIPMIKAKMGDVTSDGGIVDENGTPVYAGKVLLKSSRLRRAKKFGWEPTGRGDPAKGAQVVEVMKGKQYARD